MVHILQLWNCLLHVLLYVLEQLKLRNFPNGTQLEQAGRVLTTAAAVAVTAIVASVFDAPLPLVMKIWNMDIPTKMCRRDAIYLVCRFLLFFFFFSITVSRSRIRLADGASLRLSHYLFAKSIGVLFAHCSGVFSLALCVFVCVQSTNSRHLNDLQLGLYMRMVQGKR